MQYFLDKNVPKNPPTLTESHTHTDLPLSTAAILLLYRHVVAYEIRRAATIWWIMRASRTGLGKVRLGLTWVPWSLPRAVVTGLNSVW